MIGLYRHIWTVEGTDPPTKLTVWFTLSVSITFPLALGIALDYPVVGIVALSVVGCAIGITMFFNVSQFAVLIFPLCYVSANHHLLLVLTILIIVSYMAERIRSSDLSLKIAYPVALIILVLSGLNGVARAFDIDLGRYAFQYNLVTPILIFFIYYNLDLSSDLIKRNLFVICLIAAFIGWISLGMYIQTGLPRQIAGWPSQNLAAAFFGMLLPYAVLSVIDAPDSERRMLWIFIFVGIISGIFVTQTRAILISTFVSMLYIGWKDRRVLRIMMPAILIALVAMPTLIFVRMAMMFGKGVHPDWSSVGRVQIWMNSIKIIPDYFFFGMGMYSFLFIYPALFPGSFIRALHPHNNYLRWLFELGIIGMTSYLYIIVSTLKKSLRPVRRISKDEWMPEERLLVAINAGVIGALLAALVDMPLSSPHVATMFWTFMAFQMILTKRISLIRGSAV